MTYNATAAQVGANSLTTAIVEFLKSGDDLGDQATPEEQNRLHAAFDALLKWKAPAAAFEDAIAALRIVRDEFRMGQEGDGLARSMLEAALGFLDAPNGSSRPMPAKRRWSRRAILKIAA